MMSSWFNHPPAPPVDTAGLANTFMALDARLSRVQAEVEDYRTFADRNLDGVWSTIRSQCDEAIMAYMALVSPTEASVQNCAVTLQAAIVALEGFEDGNSRALSLGIKEKARQAAEAEKVRQEAVQAQEEADRLAAELPWRAQRALADVEDRIEAAQGRLGVVAPSISTLLREFSTGCSKDLLDNERKAQEFIWRAGDKLAEARISSNPEKQLECARLIRIDLGEARELIEAVPARRALMCQVKADPQAPAAKVKFKIHDAWMYAERHGKLAEYSVALNNSKRRVEEIEAGLTGAHPDYWAYQNGLDKVGDFVQTVVARMRG